MDISNHTLDIILSMLLEFGVFVLILIYLDYRRNKKDDDPYL